MCLILEKSFCQSKLNFTLGHAISEEWSSPSIDLFYKNVILSKLGLETGINYSSANKSGLQNSLTYDWKSYNLFAGFYYEVQIAKKIRLNPFVDVAYGHWSYSLNEFESPSKEKGAFSAFSGIDIILILNEQFDLIIRNRYANHFIKFQRPDGLIIPTNIIESEDSKQESLNINVGITYKLL